MEKKIFIPFPNLSYSNTNTKTSSISLSIPSPINSTTSLLDHIISNKFYSENIVLTQPIINRLLSETFKQEKNIAHLSSPTVVNTVHLDPRDSLSFISMANTNSHHMSSLNSSHLPDGGSYFVTGLTDLPSSYKLNPSSNTDMPSPSSSSNSSNPPSSSHHHHHQTRRHEGGDPTRKREMRLQKNREAARECRRKKKEYIKCLEERVAGLEAQNKALIEELRQLKELYCQREDPNNKNHSKTATTSTR